MAGGERLATSSSYLGGTPGERGGIVSGPGMAGGERLGTSYLVLVQWVVNIEACFLEWCVLSL